MGWGPRVPKSLQEVCEVEDGGSPSGFRGFAGLGTEDTSFAPGALSICPRLSNAAAGLDITKHHNDLTTEVGRNQI